jgi:magnesium transporter
MLVFNKQTNDITKENVRMPHEDEVAWISLLSTQQEQVRQVLVDFFHCHPLLVEDCIKLNQRPKLDRYKNNFLITFFSLSKSLKPLELAIVIGHNYIVTISHEPIPFLDRLYEEFQQIEGRMEHPGDILYHILDRCVDEYVEIVNQLEDQVDRLERNLHRNPYIKIAHDIYRHKRSMHRMRRIFVDERIILSMISHQSFPYTRQETDVYFIDIYDHISRVIDSLDIFRESLSGLLELQMNMKSDRMNEVMKTLTIVSSFFLPLTFIVGIYGMNFRWMPELDWQFGYFAVWIIIIVVAISMWFFYKRKKWL